MGYMPGFSNGYTSIAWSNALNAPGREPFTIRPLPPAVARMTEQAEGGAASPFQIESQTGIIVRIRT